MDNIRGGALMVLAMAGFTLEDTFIKQLSGSLPVGQIMILLGAGGALVFAVLSLRRGDALFSGDFMKRPVLMRNLGEVIAAVGYINAIALIPLSSAAAILQATPLCVTLGAALFLREEVGWRRWSAIVIGFIGVLMIIRPGLEGFRPASLFAVLGVAGLALRDLSTRAIPSSVSTLQVSSYAFAILVPTGIVLLALSGGGAMPTAINWLYLFAAMAFGVCGYYAIVAAMRIGEVSFVTPFRYTRLIFSLILGMIVFAERPDLLTYLGALLIIVSGLYSILREQRLARRAAPPIR